MQISRSDSRNYMNLLSFRERTFHVKRPVYPLARKAVLSVSRFTRVQGTSPCPGRCGTQEGFRVLPPRPGRDRVLRSLAAVPQVVGRHGRIAESGRYGFGISGVVDL